MGSLACTRFRLTPGQLFCFIDAIATHIILFLLSSVVSSTSSTLYILLLLLLFLFNKYYDYQILTFIYFKKYMFVNCCNAFLFRETVAMLKN